MIPSSAYIAVGQYLVDKSHSHDLIKGIYTLEYLQRSNFTSFHLNLFMVGLLNPFNYFRKK